MQDGHALSVWSLQYVIVSVHCHIKRLCDLIGRGLSHALQAAAAAGMRVVVVPSLPDRDAYPPADPDAASGAQH